MIFKKFKELIYPLVEKVASTKEVRCNEFGIWLSPNIIVNSLIKDLTYYNNTLIPIKNGVKYFELHYYMYLLMLEIYNETNTWIISPTEFVIDINSPVIPSINSYYREIPPIDLEYDEYLGTIHNITFTNYNNIMKYYNNYIDHMKQTNIFILFSIVKDDMRYKRLSKTKRGQYVTFNLAKSHAKIWKNIDKRDILNGEMDILITSTDKENALKWEFNTSKSLVVIGDINALELAEVVLWEHKGKYTESCSGLNRLELLRLLYMIQLAFIAKEGVCLFGNVFSCWAYGPVISALWNKFDYLPAMDIEPIKTDYDFVSIIKKSKLKYNDRYLELFRETINIYKHFSPWELTSMIYKEFDFEHRYIQNMDVIVDIDMMFEDAKKFVSVVNRKKIPENEVKI